MKKFLFTALLTFMLFACGDSKAVSPSDVGAIDTGQEATQVSFGVNLGGNAGGKNLAPNFPVPTSVYLYGSLVSHTVDGWAGDIASVAGHVYTTVGGALNTSFPWFINEWFTVGANHNSQWRIDGMWANINGSVGSQTDLTTVCVYGGDANFTYSVPYLAARPALGGAGAFIENYVGTDNGHCQRNLFTVDFDVQNTASYPLTSSVVVHRQSSNSWDPVLLEQPVMQINTMNTTNDGRSDVFYSMPSGVRSWIWYEYPRPISPSAGIPQMARNVIADVYDAFTGLFVCSEQLTHIIDIDPDLINTQWAYEISEVTNAGGCIIQGNNNINLVLGPPTP